MWKKVCLEFEVKQKCLVKKEPDDRHKKMTYNYVQEVHFKNQVLADD